MYIKSVDLKNFRNYENTKIEFINGINVIYGRNGQGKTNIVESIYIASTGKSHRNSRDLDMLKFGQESFNVFIKAMEDNDETTLDILFRKEKGKMIKVNEIPVKKYSDLVGRMRSVIFAPDDLGIIKDGPSERRRFLDNAISQIKPNYLYQINRMNKVFANKNALIKSKRDFKTIKDELEIWNDQLSRIFAYVMRERLSYIERLSFFSDKRCKEISGNEELIEIKYKTLLDKKEILENNEIEKKIYDIMNIISQDEVRRNGIIYGVQRDEIKIIINGKEAKTYGSQGQQRTAALSLKLAEMDIIESEFNENPILMLDDVMSELDEYRRDYLFKSINGRQIIITCTEKDIVPKNVYNVKYINVDKGEISCFCI